MEKRSWAHATCSGAQIARAGRDGFTSLEVEPGSPKTLAVTNALTFSGRVFFANVGVSAAQGGGSETMAANAVGPTAVTVAVVDAATGAAIAPFTHENCRAITADSVHQAAAWKGAADLSAVANKTVRLWFELTARVQLFSFWVSRSRCGESNGYVAAGEKGCTGMTDTTGSCAP